MTLEEYMQFDCWKWEVGNYVNEQWPTFFLSFIGTMNLQIQEAQCSPSNTTIKRNDTRQYNNKMTEGQ